MRVALYAFGAAFALPFFVLFLVGLILRGVVAGVSRGYDAPDRVKAKRGARDVGGYHPNI